MYSCKSKYMIKNNVKKNENGLPIHRKDLERKLTITFVIEGKRAIKVEKMM